MVNILLDLVCGGVTLHSVYPRLLFCRKRAKAASDRGIRGGFAAEALDSGQAGQSKEVWPVWLSEMVGSEAGARGERALRVEIFLVGGNPVGGDISLRGS